MPDVKLQIDENDIRIFKQKSEEYNHDDRCIRFNPSRLFSLNFEASDIPFEKVIQTAVHYELPVLFAYQTAVIKQDRPFSKEYIHKGYQVAFLNDVPITDPRARDIMKNAIATIFSQFKPNDVDVTDTSNTVHLNDPSLQYLDKSIPEVNIEALFRNLTIRWMMEYGNTHYKSKIKRFADDNGLKLTSKNLLDVSVSFDPSNGMTKNEESNNMIVKNGKFSPSSFIIYKTQDGEKLPNGSIRYEIKYDDGSYPHVDTKNKSSSHKSKRSLNINKIRPQCQLFREFEDGSRSLSRLELTGLSTSLLQVESGRTLVTEIMNKYSTDSDSSSGKYPYKYWRCNLAYMSQMDYESMRCDIFCPYAGTCNYTGDIISTVAPERKTIAKSVNSRDQFHSLDDAEADFKHNLSAALNADDTRIHAINAPVGIGKSTIVLNYMEKHPHQRILVALSTNDLKNELYDKARDRFTAVKSPSIAEFRHKLPLKIREQIERLYQLGKPLVVTEFIKETIADENVDKDCADLLRGYLNDLTTFHSSTCHAFTTHARLLTFDHWVLKQYDAVIVDEDIIMNCMIPNQVQILITEFKKILEQVGAGSDLAVKITKALKPTESESLFSLDRIHYDRAYDDVLTHIDLPSFCAAEKFYFRRKSDENNLQESYRSGDSLIFFQPLKLNPQVKYIMLSATIDQKICNYYWGSNRVMFYDCKKAAYTGTINQYTEHTMSRSDIAKKPGILERIAKFTGNKNCITFKKHSDGSAIYFGKTTGVDVLKGMDLDIVGTPHQPEFLYKLFAYTMGYNIDADARMNYQAVMYGDYRFWFMTFDEDNDVLRNIQFWMIQSELAQAVGRARPLREKCVVNIFSNFPVHQAVAKVFQ